MRSRSLLQALVLATVAYASRPTMAGERAHKPDTLAVARLRAEAAAGRPIAETSLGYAYEYGLGVPKSYEQAWLWFSCAAEQSEPFAQFFLGLLYDRGLGVAENPIAAEMWLELAAAHAPFDRRDYWATMRDEIARKMTLDEATEGRRLAVAWIPSHACAVHS